MYNLKEKERIFVFTGPDGSGRKTVAKLVGDTLNMKGIVSSTTRKKRHYEREDVDYHYLSREAFAKAQENGEFIEKVEINGHLYGIKEAEVAESFQKHGCIYLVLNKEGADILKDLYGDKVIRMFLYADRNTVIERQKERGDSEEVIREHMSHYDEEMEYKQACEHAFENYELAHTTFEVTNAVEAYLKENIK
ncbi:guanylate kinase [Desertibacillus haloalkaliphilus]|uniref:guanylate kinase n=1 Tax=Desertibacillus haloalkaliphilus TaxID=1328930 RepID=UPI001C27125D|nr:guanylate kinase [Desertibacillus haloalkaliphilus]MBU8907321.1 guanylate kinase [Desertibacillus haloalkaliphilus]